MTALKFLSRTVYTWILLALAVSLFIPCVFAGVMVKSYRKFLDYCGKYSSNLVKSFKEHYNFD